MDMYKLKFTKLQNEIFRVLCIKSGTPLNQRNLAHLLKVSPTAIGKAIKPLVKSGIIDRERHPQMNLTIITLNRKKPNIIALKRIENLKLLYESEILSFLEENFRGSTIIVFGSYATGEDTFQSDIDLAIINARKKDLSQRKFEKLLERPITLHTYASLKSIEKNLRSNILNGIVLSGAIEL